MELFRQMVNQSIEITQETGIASLTQLSTMNYHELKNVQRDSRYRLYATFRTAGILKNHRNFQKKHTVRTPRPDELV